MSESEPLPVSLICVVRDGGRDLRELSSFFSKFADVVIVDDGSQDDTASLARALGYQLCSGATLNDFAAKRSLGIAHATQPWVLMVDADERPMTGFIPELRRLISQSDIAAYEVNFRTFFGEDWMRHSGVYPLWVLRLFRRDAFAGFVGSVHERVSVRGQTRRSALEFEHYSYSSTRHYVEKINRYTDLEAAELLAQAHVTALPPVRLLTRSLVAVVSEIRAEGYSATALRDSLKRNIKNRFVIRTLLPFYPAGRFVHLYFLRRGYRDGFPGLRYAILSACYSVLKYVKLFEIRNGRYRAHPD